MNDNKIKDKLKQLLFEHDLTPTELARKVDLPQQTIQRIVKGKIGNPHPKTLNVLADYFGISTTQFKGDDPFLSAKDQTLKNNEEQPSQKIGVYSWDKLNDLVFTQIELQPKEKIFVGNAYSKKTFGVIMEDSSMTPFFPKDSILIIDPEKIPADRSYIIAYLHDVKKYLFRQLLSDGENFFLKALNSDLSTFPIRKLHTDDKICGELVESRQIYAKQLENNLNDK